MIVVIGATGTVGREAVRWLHQRGVQVGAVTRNPTADLPPGVRMILGDPSSPDSLAHWPFGTEAVLVSPRAVGPATAELLALAAARGAQRVVLLSSATVQHPAGHRRFADEFRAAEQAVDRSGLPWTYLRCADFAANALAWAPQLRATGVVRGAYPDAVTSPVHERDIAEVAARALTTTEHAGRAYVLTGPQPLDQREKVRLIGEAVGRNLTFEEVAPEQVRRALLAHGLPEDVPERLLGSLADYATTRGPLTDSVAHVLGRPARTFAAWAAAHAPHFAHAASGAE